MVVVLDGEGWSGVGGYAVHALSAYLCTDEKNRF